MSNAHIEIRRNDPGPGKQKHKKSFQVATDNAGRFYASLPPGNGDVFAYSGGFAPTCAVVLVESDKTTAVNLRFPNYAPMSLDNGIKSNPSNDKPSH